MFNDRSLLKAMSRLIASIEPKSYLTMEVELRVKPVFSGKISPGLMKEILQPPKELVALIKIPLPSVKSIKLMGTMDYGDVVTLHTVRFNRFMLELESGKPTSAKPLTTRYKIRVRS